MNERKLIRQIKKIEDDLSTKAALPDPSSTAFEERQALKKIREINKLILSHPDRELFLLILELINDTKNQLQPIK